MIITEPNEFVAEIHDRMPVLLSENDFEPWLCGDAGLEFYEASAERSASEMGRIEARE
jgi:putative SOS response-associated peptidase YedK